MFLVIKGSVVDAVNKSNCIVRHRQSLVLYFEGGRIDYCLRTACQVAFNGTILFISGNGGVLKLSRTLGDYIHAVIAPTDFQRVSGIPEYCYRDTADKEFPCFFVDNFYNSLRLVAIEKFVY